MAELFEPFESPKSLIQDAEERILQLEAICKPFTEGCGYDIISEDNFKSREKIIKLRLKKRLPRQAEILASGIINDLRHALDQAVCDAGRATGHHRVDRLYFPFGRSLDDLNNEIARKCKDLDPELIAFIRNFEPYREGNVVAWTLSRLAAKKHQRVIEASLEDAMSFQFAIIQAKGPLKLIINKWNPAQSELEVARLPPGSELKFQEDFILKFRVLLGKGGETLAYRPLIASLNHFSGIAKGIVLGIETETARILRERGG